ncbi:MAG: methyltransferase domain-containing protein [Akkermansiaceae bacterium]|nr:methyltransferase domain-containing protein [Akkermansiaceae bacterium]
MKYLPKHELILSRCAGKSILHLGCVGNNDYSTEHKVAASPSTLHMKLSAASRVTGVDISADAVEEYKRNGICDNILVGDVEELGKLNLRPEFDWVVVGDLIEHLSNPGRMLDGVRALCRSDTRVMLTTPHAFGLAPFLRHFRGRFREGLQHVMTFNEQNLGNLVRRHCFRIEETGTCYQPESDTGTLTFKLGRKLFEKFPHLGGTLYVILARDDG